MNWPFTMMPIFVERASASSMECVVNTTQDYFLFVLILLISVHMNRFAWGSTPVLGSSKRIIGGLPMRAMQHWSLRLFPPDKVPACTRANYSKSISAKLCAINSL